MGRKGKNESNGKGSIGERGKGKGGINRENP
jgi:hypothetical protein